MKFIYIFVAAVLATFRLFAAEADTSPRFPVEQLIVGYGHEYPTAPSPETLGILTVDLDKGDDGAWVVGDKSTVKLKLSEPLPAGTRISEAALRNIFGAIVGQLNAKGFYGVVAFVRPEQIDPQSKEDLRPATDKTLNIVVWFSEVAQVRTVAKGSRIKAGSPVSHPKHARIVANSPLRAPPAGQAGGLLNKTWLDDYLRRLNRQPGRSVEAALSSTDEPGRVVLDYLVTEQKPWLVYAQISNTGTEATDELRERVGFVQNQLFNRDDVASIDYITSNFTKANAVFGSYNYPLLFPDRLRARAYGSWGDFNATTPESAVSTGTGVQFQNFSGDSWTGGLELIASPFSLWSFAVDFTVGATFEHVGVRNETIGTVGSADLLTPYATVRIERTNEIWSFAGSIGYETNVKKIDASELVPLGRFDTQDTYDLIRGELSASTYLEPLFFGVARGSDWRRSTLAHEFSFQARGQFVLGDDRLIPQKEQALGGFFSVRGYPESAVAGDNVYSFSTEYRFHIPRALRPATETEKDKTANARIAQEPAPTLFGRSFNLRPPRISARPDWDLVARAFFDAGFTEINLGTATAARAGERNYRLMSAGVGLELQMFQNLNLRADWGYVLKEVKTGLDATATTAYIPGANDTKSGSSRLHLLLTLVW